MSASAQAARTRDHIRGLIAPAAYPTVGSLQSQVRRWRPASCVRRHGPLFPSFPECAPKTIFMALSGCQKLVLDALAYSRPAKPPRRSQASPESLGAVRVPTLRGPACDVKAACPRLGRV
jgi:hypothetical protein